MQFNVCSQWLDWVLFAEHDALDLMSSAGGTVRRRSGRRTSLDCLGRLEFSRHSGKKAGQDELFFHSDDRVVGAGHADVGLVGGAVGETRSSAVGIWVWVPRRAVIRPSEVPAHGHFFAGGLAVQVEENDLCGDLAEELVGFAEGIVTAGHEDAALQVHDGVALAVAEFTLIDAEAGGADGVVGGGE